MPVRYRKATAAPQHAHKRSRRSSMVPFLFSHGLAVLCHEWGDMPQAVEQAKRSVLTLQSAPIGTLSFSMFWFIFYLIVNRPIRKRLIQSLASMLWIPVRDGTYKPDSENKPNISVQENCRTQWKRQLLLPMQKNKLSIVFLWFSWFLLA